MDLEKPLVGMCNSGMSSCTSLLAAYMAGKQDAQLYLVSPNSQTQWTFTANAYEFSWLNEWSLDISKKCLSPSRNASWSIQRLEP